MFGSPKKAPPNPKDLLKANKRQVQKSQHEIQREILQLDRQEKEALTEIKKLASKGQDAAVRILAKQVVTIRSQRERMQKSHAQLNGLKTAGSAMSANLAVTSAMAGTARVMSAVNSTMSVESLTSAMQEMEKSMQISEMQDELLDELLDDSDEEVEADDVMSQVFEELGLDLKTSLAAAPAAKSVAVGVGRASPVASVRGGVSRSGASAAASSSSAASSSALSFDEPLTAQEEAEADRMLAELGV
jgi:division protein CdvB (Snf7/Vps24/ESCRT-III family)